MRLKVIGVKILVWKPRVHISNSSARAQFKPGFGAFPDVVVERVERPTRAVSRVLTAASATPTTGADRWDWTGRGDPRAPNEARDHTARGRGAAAPSRDGTSLRRVPEDRLGPRSAYFGLLPDAIGQGLGKHLLSCAVRDAWALGPARVWLHTCTLDHPAALPNYKKAASAPYKTETYEVNSPS